MGVDYDKIKRELRLTTAQIDQICDRFAIFDRDGSGSVTLSELCAAVAQLGLDMTEEEVIFFFCEFSEIFEGGGNDGRS